MTFHPAFYLDFIAWAVRRAKAVPADELPLFVDACLQPFRALVGALATLPTEGKGLKLALRICKWCFENTDPFAEARTRALAIRKAWGNA